MLRAATLAVTVLNTAGAPLVLIATIIMRRRHTPSWIIGTVMAGLALGGLAGAGLMMQYLSVSTTMLVFAIAGGYAASRKHLREAPWPIITDQSRR